MLEYQLKTLIMDLYNNDLKLRKLSAEGLLTSEDIWRIQETAVKMAANDQILSYETSCGHKFYKLTKGGSAACGEFDCNNYIY